MESTSPHNPSTLKLVNPSYEPLVSLPEKALSLHNNFCQLAIILGATWIPFFLNASFLRGYTHVTIFVTWELFLSGLCFFLYQSLFLIVEKVLRYVNTIFQYYISNIILLAVYDSTITRNRLQRDRLKFPPHCGTHVAKLLPNVCAQCGCFAKSRTSN